MTSDRKLMRKSERKVHPSLLSGLHPACFRFHRASVSPTLSLLLFLFLSSRSHPHSLARSFSRAISHTRSVLLEWRTALSTVSASNSTLVPKRNALTGGHRPLPTFEGGLRRSALLYGPTGVRRTMSDVTLGSLPELIQDTHRHRTLR